MAHLQIEPAGLMERLARRRPLFHSEADFQHAFAWELHQLAPEVDIRLEVPVRADGGAVHLDLLACLGDSRMAIELKYKTRGLTSSVNGEDFLLADQAAQDVGRYDFFKDLLRIETFVQFGAGRTGYAIFLTNDSAYWKQPAALDHGYVGFAMNHGRKVTGARHGERGLPPARGSSGNPRLAFAGATSSAGWPIRPSARSAMASSATSA